MFLKTILSCLVLTNLQINSGATDARVVARVGEEKITYEDVVSMLVKLLSSQGVSMQQFMQAQKNNPENLEKIIKQLRDAVIDQKVLSMIAERKKYRNNPAYQAKIAKVLQAAEVQFYSEEKNKEVELDSVKISEKIAEMQKRAPEVKQFIGRVIVVNKKSDADGIVKVLNIRDKAKSLEGAFTDLGSKHSITDYQDKKGSFSMSEHEIVREYGQTAVDSLKMTKEGQFTSVILFKSSSKFNEKYGVFYLSKIGVATKPSADELKPYAIRELVAEIVKSEIEKEKKSLEIRKYNKDGLLEENSPTIDKK